MIHWRKEGQHIKIGLNIVWARGHFTVAWVGYDFASHTGSMRGFDLSRHGLRRRSAQWNVIENYLRVRDLALVHVETLQDLRDAEAADLRYADSITYVRATRLH